MTIEYTLTLLVVLAASAAGPRLLTRYRREFVIHDGFAGLLYDSGRLVGSLVSGRHIRWGRQYEVSLFNLREILDPPDAGTTEGEATMTNVIVATHLFAVRTAARTIDEDASTSASVAEQGFLGGVSRRILLSDHSGPGAVLRETLLHRPSLADD